MKVQLKKVFILLAIGILISSCVRKSSDSQENFNERDGLLLKSKSLSLKSTSLVGVDDQGNQLVKIEFLDDGKMLFSSANGPSESVEAVRTPVQNCEGWDLGKGRFLTQCAGVGGMGNYRDRVNHYYIDFESKHVELRPNVDLIEK